MGEAIAISGFSSDWQGEGVAGKDSELRSPLVSGVEEGRGGLVGSVLHAG